MGQYYRVVNVTKREFFRPHELGCGAKLMEFAGDEKMGAALALLLAIGNGRGGGDLDDGKANWSPDFPFCIVGRWAGDAVAIVGDYADWPDFAGPPPTDVSPAEASLYHVAVEEYTDIGQLVLQAVKQALLNEGDIHEGES